MDLSNHFLLAMPGLTGDYFADSLIYICEHGEDGALGLIVNRPGPVSVLELLAQLSLSASARWADVPVYEGGPVASDQALVLHSGEPQYSSSMQSGPEVCMASAMEVLEAIASDNAPAQFLVALGYAGWDAGQLEEEIAANAWLTVPADPQIIFSLPAEQRAARAAATLGIDMRYMATRAGHA